MRWSAAASSTLLLSCIIANAVLSQTTAAEPLSRGTLQAHRYGKRQETSASAGGGGGGGGSASTAVSVSVSATQSTGGSGDSESSVDSRQNTSGSGGDNTTGRETTPSETSIVTTPSSTIETISQSTATTTTANTESTDTSTSTGVTNTNTAASTSNTPPSTAASSTNIASSSNVASSTVGTTALSSAGVSTVIVTQTASDGQVFTSQSLSTDTSQQTDTSKQGTNQEEPSNSKKWIIPLSVTGGIILLAGILVIGYRFTSRRFSDLDDDTGRAIRWPELLRRNDHDDATLTPTGLSGKEGATGYEMDDTKSTYAGSSIAQPRDYDFASAGLAAPGMNISRSTSSAGSAAGSNVGPGIGGGAYYAGPQQGYYDPYLGVSSAPFPPPPRTMSPQQGAYYSNAYPSDMYAPSVSPQPYYPPVPPGAQYAPPPPMRATSPFTSPRVGSPVQRAPSVPLEHQAHAQDPHYNSQPVNYSYNEQEEMKSLSPPLSPSQNTLVGGNTSNAQKRQSQGMRLSLANPSKEDED